MMQIKNLTKIYNHNDGVIYALDNVSLDVPKGSFITVTGPSGSGKTTLLLSLGGLLRPTSGKISFENTELDLHNDKQLAHFRHQHVGFVMQSFALIPYLTAAENLMIALNVKNRSKKEKREKAEALLKWVGLSDRVNHFPRELSAGQQQRVAIARALAHNPTLILADEPTGNLDPNLSLEILSMLKEINQTHQTTIIMVTHSPIAAEYGNIRVRLMNGKIIN